MNNDNLVGIGVYTTAEAGRLLDIPGRKIARWLKGHKIGNKQYAPLWSPQVDLGDEGIFLGFRDLMEMRTAAAFMDAGVSAIMIRRAIEEARKYFADEHPLSTTSFRTDGRSIFIEIADKDGDTKLLDLFRRQYAFKRILDASLKGVEFDGIAPSRWWPITRQKQIVVDPRRSFGQPIESGSGVPTAVLAQAARMEGVAATARSWRVSPSAVRHAMEFESSLEKAA